MSGRTDSDTEPPIFAAGEERGDRDSETRENHEDREREDRENHEHREDQEQYGDQEQYEDQDEDGEHAGDAGRARWTAAGTGALLTLAGLAAALLRAAGSAPALVPAAYALGAAVCALAAVLGFRGRTRRALWLLIAGTMVMAFGDQFD
ncbi:hypothetical protein [Streptomyces cinerochromogenes]|uniref:hypothetical protein n=1 Tax=Streptomyces cinerochromogenes TaxID=66422 RepID=UPI001670FEC9|nr:hypothetical protein [Streptomyces cinerochromogenes]GGS96459.1 hypothetical protein GCM10010206_68960 [Streptomyces cinerochromogenes]